MDIKVSDVQNMLSNGKTREDIKEHYGISNRDLKALFQHPKLKGLKTKTPYSPGFTVVDDTENNVSQESHREDDVPHADHDHGHDGDSPDGDD